MTRLSRRIPSATEGNPAHPLGPAEAALLIALNREFVIFLFRARGFVTSRRSTLGTLDSLPAQRDDLIAIIRIGAHT